HHHAHMASAMAENGLSEPVIGVIFDGTGLGVDGTIWGGEFLVGEYARFDRAAHFRYVRMPGSSRAIAQPWRMALSYLLDAGVNPEEIIKRVPQSTMRQVSALTGKDAFSPKTSSCGRFFDAVAAMIGVRNDIRYEGQAAIELEWLAAQAEQQSGYAFELDRRTEPMIIDIRPMVRAIATDVKHHRAPAEIARAFHTGVVDIVADVCMTIRAAYGIDRVVLSGGVFANTILLSEVPPRLEQRGFRVYTHSVVPCNDGGLCLGQLAVAAVH
ncbi:MAG TPA: carbamoyltransferase HypF, partial [Planctomycetota bacterium]|nr:carbamoyltransferase HypF [Planctomycetota bacterium]